MTRFARYSTKGIKKPPLDATPWSELAPPSALKRANPVPSAAPTCAVDEEPVVTSTRNGKKFKEKTSHGLGQLAAASTGKKKGKKSAAKHLSLPHEFSDDGDEPVKPDVDDSVEIESPKKGLKRAHSDKMKQPEIQGAKKKKKRQSSEGVVTAGLEVDDDDDMPAASVPEDDTFQLLSKEKKRESNDADTPKNKKTKQLITGGQMASPSAVSEAEHGYDNAEEEAPEPGAAKRTKNINGSGVATKKKKKKQQQQKAQPKLPGAAASGTPLLAEGPLMTQFEGYWVRRRAVTRLERVRAELAAAISDPQTLKREMKKRKRAEHRLLLSQLAARSGRKPTSAAARLQSDVAADDGDDDGADEEIDGSTGGEDAQDSDADSPGGEQSAPPARRRTVADVRNPTGGAPREERMVKFDGVWMTADAVGRLKELRRQLKLQRVSEMVLKQTMKTARRREEMKRKRETKRACLGCRQPGHYVSDCPNRVAGLKTPVTGLCFRCGSTEHRLSECRRPADGGKLPYAVCFVCGQTGHVSRDCALNPNGIYPKGGACKVCQRRDHLADDCPERKEEAAAASAPRLATIGDGPLEEDYQIDFRETQAPATAAATPAARTPRKVKF